MRKYRLSNQAEQDITEIVKYVSKDNLQSARRVVKAVRQTCKLIGDMPRIGRIAKDVGFKELYYFPIKKFHNYLVFYILIDKMPFMVRVLHAKRNIPTIMKKWYGGN